ncbi:MAG: hypothetical protein JXA20_19780 [Spirochaetes bacterium]|nr:hypothetical protein [Spirochaetota bacterium]
MKSKIAFTLAALCIGTAAWSQNLSTQVIDTQTAYTIERGGYQVSIMGYNEGGIELKTIIGLHDNLFLGVAFNVDRAIGKGRARANIPGVIARIKVTDGGLMFPAISIGYDSFYIGRDDHEFWEFDYRHNTIIYGPYIALTSPIYLFGGEQYVNYGVRLPVQPDWRPNDVSYFIGIDIPLGEFFRLKGEVERVFWNLRDSGDWMYNAGIRYSYVDQLGIEFAIMYEPGERINRILRIEYRNQF